jgi:hypothetical protein
MPIRRCAQKGKDAITRKPPKPTQVAQYFGVRELRSPPTLTSAL